MTRPGAKAPPSTLQAYVLHQWDWSETSLILDLFTRERGRVAVAAKGAKRPYSQLRPVLLPFQRLLVTLGKTPVDEGAELHNLRHAEWAGGAPVLAGAALFSGFYLNELLMKLLARQDPHAALFDAYAATLPALAERGHGEASAGPQAALRAFELMLLRECGLLPELSRVTLTQSPVEPGRLYRLQPEAGVTLSGGAAAHADGAEGRVWLALQQALDHGPGAIAMPALQAACTLAPTALRTDLRSLLHYHLGTTTLRSRQVMQGITRTLGRSATEAA